jgi:hypothetical protein
LQRRCLCFTLLALTPFAHQLVNGWHGTLRELTL